MKKFILFAALVITTLATQAQKCVVLDFQMGDNVTQEEAESISYEFRSTFNPSCYTVLEHGRVVRQVKELGYTSANMSKDQVRRVGRIMDAAIVVYGTLSKYMDEYSLDIFVLDVSTGTSVVNQSSVFQKSEYRTRTRAVPESIITKLCNASSGSVSGAGSSTASQGYIDLGLPSGTKWKDKNEIGFFNYDQAMSKFGNKVPAKWQWQELISNCEWIWTNGGYKVVGRNGNSIFLPAKGMINDEGNLRYSDCGYYWSSTIHENWKDRWGYNLVWRLGFSWNEIDMDSYVDSYGRSVRLVQD